MPLHPAPSVHRVSLWCAYDKLLPRLLSYCTALEEEYPRKDEHEHYYWMEGPRHTVSVTRLVDELGDQR